MSALAAKPAPVAKPAKGALSALSALKFLCGSVDGGKCAGVSCLQAHFKNEECRAAFVEKREAQKAELGLGPEFFGGLCSKEDHCSRKRCTYAHVAFDQLVFPAKKDAGASAEEPGLSVSVSVEEEPYLKGSPGYEVGRVLADEILRTKVGDLDDAQHKRVVAAFADMIAAASAPFRSALIRAFWTKEAAAD